MIWGYSLPWQGYHGGMYVRELSYWDGHSASATKELEGLDDGSQLAFSFWLSLEPHPMRPWAALIQGGSFLPQSLLDLHTDYKSKDIDHEN